VREIRTLRATGRGLETELWNGLRHQQMAKAAGQLLLPVTWGHRASPRPYQAVYREAVALGS
jgi:hypothetical protein